jgi:hypothetical protein
MALMETKAMKATWLYGILLIAFPYLSSQVPAHAGQQAAQKAGSNYGAQLGRVDLRATCSEQARLHLNRGLALLHHMTYMGARESFARAVDMDADCAMGYCGQAMSLIHPLWSDPPSEAEFKQGQAWIEKARTLGTKSARERAYIDAVAAYYEQGRRGSEVPNLAALEQGWEKVHREFPEDLEAAALYALTLLGTADPSDKDYSKQKQAGALTQKVLEANPEHPGAHHYTIHAYDYPALAERALGVARDYGDIAPAVPHALHMPSHIFTRLGKWQDSIEFNRRSADAALEHPAGDAISLHYPHAVDYLAYAYLQRAQDGAAQKILEALRSVDRPYQVHVASAYSLAAVPARLALERHAWQEAANLKARQPAEFPWDEFPAMEAISYFAQALGEARTGDTRAADRALERLADLQRQAAQKGSDYWAKQVKISRLAAQAWRDYQQGHTQRGLEIMREAAELEASTEKHPVTPGEILPAHELLADMLLEMGQHAQALTEYEAALARSAKRFNSLYGAGRAAELLGDTKIARSYYQKLDDIAAENAQRERLRRAQTFLARQ